MAMTSRQRVLGALSRKPVDRVPYALWCHFPEEDRTPRGLARAVLKYHQLHGSDFLKVTFAGGYAVADWGCVEAEKAEEDGHRVCASHGVNAPGDWEKVEPRDPASGSYGQALEAIELIMGDGPDDVPVLPTLFSPLSLARKLSGDRLQEDLKSHPEAVIHALEAIAETQIRFAAACLEAGCEGIFYSIQVASRKLFSEDEYVRFGEPYDQRFLESLSGSSRVTVLHAHGEELMFDRLARLPAHAINWHDRETRPSLKEGKAQLTGAVVGGLDHWKTLRKGTPDEVRAGVRDAIEQTGGGEGLIIGPGCVLPLDIPPENMAAVVEALAL